MDVKLLKNLLLLAGLSGKQKPPIRAVDVIYRFECNGRLHLCGGWCWPSPCLDRRHMVGRICLKLLCLLSSALTTSL